MSDQYERHELECIKTAVRTAVDETFRQLDLRGIRHDIRTLNIHVNYASGGGATVNVRGPGSEG